DEWFENPTEGVLKSAALVPEIRAAPLWEPRDRFVTGYRIAIQDGQLETTLLSHEQPGDGAAPGSERWLIAGGLAPRGSSHGDHRSPHAHGDTPPRTDTDGSRR